MRERLCPQQIAGKLRSMSIPCLKEAYVCRETIYSEVYALPVGELRICLRQGKKTRMPRFEGAALAVSRNTEYSRAPLEIEDSLMAGHWQGDLIKGTANGSVVGILVERTSGCLMLVKMSDVTATSTTAGLQCWAQSYPTGDA
ncbi:hypothetical protein [Pseudomonas kielensis]|uniref:hypothetical protein n=1 Tax=Pseudomonas kielensis TaxID=2762577 RepID=UPI003906BACC